MSARVSVSEFPLPIPGRLAPIPRVPFGTAVLSAAALGRERLALGPGDTVSMLGWAGPLDWRQDDEALRVPLTPEMREASLHAWGFQIRKSGEG